MPDIIPTPPDPTTAEIPAFIRDNPKTLAAFGKGWNGISTQCARLSIPFDPAAAWRAGIQMAQRQIRADEIKASR